MRIEVLGLCFLMLFTACATGTKNTGEHANPDASEQSSVEINFVRGHNQHRLVASLRGEAVVAQSFLDRQVLAESAVDRTHYLGFLQQASEFLKGPHRAISEGFPCRTPFTVTVRIGAETRAASGCLGSDEGALSHLVRDGEFLLHQGSGMRVK